MGLLTESRAGQYSTKCVKQALERIPHSIINEPGLSQALHDGLSMYRRVFPADAYEEMVKFLIHGTPQYSLFLDPEALRLIRKKPVEQPVICDTDFPVFDTAYPKGNQGTDRVMRLTNSLVEQGFIAFPQSKASALPYWLVRERYTSGDLQLTDNTLNIVDMCGAPGNKTFNLCHLPDVSRVRAVINDIDPKRTAEITQRLFRFQFSPTRHNSYTKILPDGRSVEILLTNFDAANTASVQQAVDQTLGDSPNVVIADVECSGDGIILSDVSKLVKYPSREPAKYAFQRQVLENGLSIVRPKGQGVVSYSTCSVNPRVNEEVIYDTISNPRYTCIPTPFDNVNIFPEIEHQENLEKRNVIGVRAIPHKMGDGFFASLLEKIT